MFNQFLLPGNDLQQGNQYFDLTKVFLNSFQFGAVFSSFGGYTVF